VPSVPPASADVVELIPTHPNAERIQTIPGGSSQAAYFLVDAPIDEIRDYYAEEMARQGWQEGFFKWSEEPQPSTDSASYERDGQKVKLTVIANYSDGRTLLQVEGQ
jgi:hypothetical protein